MNETSSPDNLRDSALNYALKLLSFQARTVRQISKKLKERNFSDETIDDIIKVLKKQGYLDDKKYAEQWIEEKNRTQPTGRFLAEKKLADKGIESTLAKKILAKKLSPAKEIILARSLAKRKLKQNEAKFSDYPEQKIFQKLLFFLTSRGFDYSTAAEALNSVKIKP